MGLIPPVNLTATCQAIRTAGYAHLDDIELHDSQWKYGARTMAGTRNSLAGYIEPGIGFAALRSGTVASSHITDA